MDFLLQALVLLMFSACPIVWIVVGYFQYSNSVILFKIDMLLCLWECYGD